VPQGIPRRRLIDRQSSARHRCLRIFLPVLFGSLFVSTVARTENSPAVLPPSGPTFAIADFDGDLRPDLASVQSGPNNSSLTNYSIQLQLSAAGMQTIRIVAPVGGLQIAARDVNGDRALDLVLTTAWLKEPVAILLNDGHGSFSRVEPAAFPAAFSKSEADKASSVQQVTDAVAAGPQSRCEICPEAKIFLHVRLQRSLVVASDSAFSIGPSLISCLGRAPPSEFLQL